MLVCGCPPLSTISSACHPPAGELLVNFDKEVLQLMRETRYIQRLGLPIPDAAQMVLLQEEKFTHYYNQLSHALAVTGWWCRAFREQGSWSVGKLEGS